MPNAIVTAFIITIIIAICTVSQILPAAMAAVYYQPQTDPTEAKVPTSGFKWNSGFQVCIFKQPKIPNAYYIWTKLAIQSWRQALREYTNDTHGWSISAHYSPNFTKMDGCNVRVFIYATYKEFPGYPNQTGAYTSVEYTNGVAESANVYLAPVVLHGDGKTEITLPTYAFRNSAVHEMGHVLGLAHMAKEKGYLMSPVFDFFENKSQLPITTLELSTLVRLYGADGLSRTISIL